VPKKIKLSKHPVIMLVVAIFKVKYSFLTHIFKVFISNLPRSFIVNEGKPKI
jgi:hypothetical protein